MTKYISKKEKIKNFFDTEIIPILRKKDLNFYPLAQAISSHLFVSYGDVEDTIKEYVSQGKIEEVRIITIPKTEIPNWLETIKQDAIRIKELDEEMQRIESLVDPATDDKGVKND